MRASLVRHGLSLTKIGPEGVEVDGPLSAPLSASALGRSRPSLTLSVPTFPDSFNSCGHDVAGCPQAGTGQRAYGVQNLIGKRRDCLLALLV